MQGSGMARRSVLLGIGVAVLGAACLFAMTSLWNATRASGSVLNVNRYPDLTEERLGHLAHAMQNAPRPRILVIGNSATIVSGFMDHLSKSARDSDSSATLARASAGGARLIDSITIPALRNLLLDVVWDAVVLQDFSSTPLNEDDQAASRFAIKEVAELASPAVIILFPHWPSGPGHPVYSGGLGARIASPNDPADYADRAREHYQAAADETGARLAPVLHEWISALEAGEDLYLPDDHHATDTGANLAADAVWRTLSEALEH